MSLKGGRAEAQGARSAKSGRATGAALEAHYRFLLWLVPAVERFPRSQKFLLGDRIQTTALDVLERLIEATYTKRRADLLARANLGLEKLRIPFRLAHDLRLLDPRRYQHAARSIDETGRDDPGQLEDWRRRIDAYLEGRRVKLHPSKTRILPTAEPAAFWASCCCRTVGGRAVSVQGGS